MALKLLGSLESSGGNVGIGTTSPSEKLHVVGNAKFYSGETNGNISVGRGANQELILNVNDNINSITAYQDSDSNGAHGFVLDREFDGSGANYFAISKGGSAQMHIDSSGNVGIGTGSPSYALDVNSNAARIGSSSQTTTSLYITATNTAGAPAMASQIIMEGYEGRGKGIFYTDSGYGGEWFSGVGYSADHDYWQVGFKESGGQAEYSTNAKFLVKYDGTIIVSAYGSGLLQTNASGVVSVDTNTYATQTWVGEQNYATDAAIGTAISNLIDSSPANLDTLNELAAALGDDASFSTTVTNSIATKLPLAGGTLTGDLLLGANQLVFGNNNVAAPSTTDTHAGTRILLYSPGGSGNHYAIGVESNNMWFNSDVGYKWYRDSSAVMTLDSSSNLAVTGTVTGSNLSGTNTGDQTLPTLSSLGALSTTGKAADSNLLDGIDSSGFVRKYTFTPGAGNTGRRYIKLFTLDNFDDGVTGILSAAGDYGDADKASYEIQIGTRTSISFDVYQTSHSAVADDYEFYYRQAANDDYEIWALMSDYNQNNQFTVLSQFGTVTYNFDSVTTTEPEELTSVTKHTMYHSGNLTPLTIGTTASTAKAGNTTTITSTQATAITNNTAKVGITATQAGHISTNNGKVSDTGTPAILSDGSVPTLNTGISAAEVRGIIGAGTSSLAIGTTASTAMAGNTAFATTAQGTLATNALPKAGGTMTGNLTMSSATPTLKFSINGAENNAGIVWEDGDAGDPSAQAAAIKWDASSNHMRFYNNDEAAERIRINSDGTTTFLGTINASAGIGGLTLANGGISGTNYNITGVNQLEIADPGEGIVFKSGSSGDMTLAIVDDSSDNILRFSGTNATFDVAGALTSTNITIADGIYHEGDGNTSFSFGTDTINLNTGGSTRINITNSITKVNNDLIITGGETLSLGERAEADDNGRTVLIEGIASGSAGEGSGRIFFSEHNSTDAGADKYGLSLYYEGNPNAQLPSGFQPNTGNATWSLRRHDNSLSGTAIMSGARSDSNVTFAGNITATGNQYFNGEFIEGDGKEMFRYSDAWLRINEDNDFSSGIYCGTGVLRTDGAFQIGSAGAKALITAAGAATFLGAVSASNFSGSSSGTNTGDQDLSSYLTAETFSSSDVVVSLSGTDVTAGESITLAGGLSYSGTTLTSANDNTTYTAGTGLTLSGTQFSVTANTYLEDISPATPSVNSATIVGETIEIAFSQSSTSGVDYYQVWSAVGSSGSYGMIAHVPQEDVAATMTVIDADFTVSDTMYYRVYAVKSGVYSTAGTINRAFSSAALDVSNMSVVNLNTAYYIQYEMPTSRFVDHVEIYMDAEAASGDLTRTGATLVYSGNNSSYMYKIGANDLDKFHQFWVEVIES